MLNSDNLYQKVEELKTRGYWNDVRDTYLHKKNIHLSRRDNNRPSYNAYVETINEIYSQLRGNTIKNLITPISAYLKK